MVPRGNPTLGRGGSDIGQTGRKQGGCDVVESTEKSIAKERVARCVQRC